MQPSWLMAALLLLATTGNAQTYSNKDSGLGINITGLNYWSSQWTVLDVMKQASNGSGALWATSNAQTWAFNTGHQSRLDLDPQGWPRSLPDANDPDFHYVTTIIFHDNPHYATGKYVVLYEGEGELLYNGPTLLSSSPGRDVVQLNANSVFHLQIRKTDPNNNGNYLRNIRIIMPGGSCSSAPTDYAASPADCDDQTTYRSFEHSYQQRIFHPLFLSDMAPFRTLRFMQFLSTIDNPTAHWGQRPQLTDASWGLSGGSPLELALQMANQLYAEPWLNIPVRVDNNYLRQYARLVKAQLDPDINFYLEFGNEVWNNAWPYIMDGDYLQEQGRRQWPDTQAQNIEYRLNYYALRAAQSCAIFKQEFAGQADRIKCVMGGQTGVPWISEQMLTCPMVQQSGGQACATEMDVLAVGSYFAGYMADERYLNILKGWSDEGERGLNKLFAEMHQGQLYNLTYNPNEPDWWQAPADGALGSAARDIEASLMLANQYGLMLAAYEGGQHLSYAGYIADGREQINQQLFLPANRDPRMAQLYTQHLDNWRASGAGLFILFESIGRWDNWGAFPLKEYQLQDKAQAVKFAAATTYAEQISCWWPACERQEKAQKNQPPVTPPSEPQPPSTGSHFALLQLAGLVDTNGIQLNWRLEGPAAVSYIIFRDEQQIAQVNQPHYNDHWLQMGQTYHYRLVALNSKGETLAVSEQVSALPGDSQPPSPPSALSVVSDGQWGLILNWQSSEDDQPISYYKIIRNGVPFSLAQQNRFHDPWPP